MNNFLQAILTKNNDAFGKLVDRLKEPATSETSVPQQKVLELTPTTTEHKPKINSFKETTPKNSVKRHSVLTKSKKSLSDQIHEAEQKKRKLLDELRIVDYQLREMKNKERLSKLPAKNLSPMQNAQKNKQALELVRRLNEQRKIREYKKLKEYQLTQAHVKQSLEREMKRKKDMKEQKTEILKNRQRQNRQEREERKMLQYVNTESDKVISNMKKNSSLFDLTAPVEEPKKAITKKYQPSPFLQNILEEEKNKKRMEQMKERERILLLEKRKSYNSIIDKIRVERKKEEPVFESIQVHYEYQPTIPASEP